MKKKKELEYLIELQKNKGGKPKKQYSSRNEGVSMSNTAPNDFSTSKSHSKTQTPSYQNLKRKRARTKRKNPQSRLDNPDFSDFWAKPEENTSEERLRKVNNQVDYLKEMRFNREQRESGRQCVINIFQRLRD